VIAEVEIFLLFIMVLMRFSGLMVAAPVLGSANIPTQVKAGLAALMALMVTAVLPEQPEPLPQAFLGLGVMAIGEFLIGLIIGFVLSLVLAAIQLAGQVMDMQTGFGLMNVFNPALETQFPIFGFFLFILAILYMLILNLHHTMIWALVMTYAHIPVGGFVYRPELLFEASLWGRGMFIDGLLVAAPITAAMLLAYVTMGLLGRVVPQIHLFVVGFPVTIATSLFLMAFVVGVFLMMLDGMFERGFRHVDTLMRGLG